MAKDKKGTNRGRIVSIRGPVLDIEFPPGKLPDMYTSLEIPRSKEKKKDTKKWDGLYFRHCKKKQI